MWNEVTVQVDIGSFIDPIYVGLVSVSTVLFLLLVLVLRLKGLTIARILVVTVCEAWLFLLITQSIILWLLLGDLSIMDVVGAHIADLIFSLRYFFTQQLFILLALGMRLIFLICFCVHELKGKKKPFNHCPTT